MHSLAALVDAGRGLADRLVHHREAYDRLIYMLRSQPVLHLDERPAVQPSPAS